MNESFLYFIWQHRLYPEGNLKALTGEEIEILHPGHRNTESGPDFFDARITIDGIMWAGNVEIHVKASDWLQHEHDSDPAYRNVILHVVYEHDCNISGPSGATIPVMQLDFNRDYFRRYQQLVQNTNPIPCYEDSRGLEPFRTTAFLQSLALERLCEKAAAFRQRLQYHKNDWEETFYQALARNFGFHINGQPFEMLANAVPLKVLARHRDNLQLTEALLMGQAGLLNGDAGDEYYSVLRRDYLFLAEKFGLTPINPAAWKFSPVRPGNQPAVRIAQFASLLHSTYPLFDRILHDTGNTQTEALLRSQTSAYWQNHCRFGTATDSVSGRLGRSSYHLIAINTIAPFLYLYGTVHEEERYASRAVELLETIPPEQNHIVSLWKKTGWKPGSAMDTQALIHLYKNYCSSRRCIECTLGATIVTRVSS